MLESKVLLLLLISMISSAYGGVGTLSPQDEQNVINLFFRVCGEQQQPQGGYGGYGGGYGGPPTGPGGPISLGDSTIFCKSARDDFHETVTHQVHVPSSSNKPQSQVIFVRPPAVRYQHQIYLQGVQGPGGGQGTKIYVLPQKTSHQIQTSYNPGVTPTQKPVVYFLTKSSNNNNNNKPVSYGPPPPPPVYGPPPPPQNRPVSSRPIHQDQGGYLALPLRPSQPDPQNRVPSSSGHPHEGGGYLPPPPNPSGGYSTLK